MALTIKEAAKQAACWASRCFLGVVLERRPLVQRTTSLHLHLFFVGQHMVRKPKLQMYWLCILDSLFSDKLTDCISLNAQDLETADDPFPFPDARPRHCSIYSLLRALTNRKPNMYIHICGRTAECQLQDNADDATLARVMQLKQTMLVWCSFQVVCLLQSKIRPHPLWKLPLSG